VAENSIDRKKVCNDLTIERAKLFKQFSKHPMDTRLALTIKIIDNQIADFAEWIRTRARARNSKKEHCSSLKKLRRELIRC
jgi:hypothetical protein